MAGMKGLISRVRRLEPKAGYVVRRIGSADKFAAEVNAGIESGRYDPVDMSDVAYCVRKWAAAGY
jgi:hypothetical protein